MHFIRRLVLAAALVVLASCSGGDSVAPATTFSAAVTTTAVQTSVVPPTAVPTTAEPVAPVVFDNDFGDSVAPIIEHRCASCHNVGGPGAQHWKLETAQDVVGASPFIAERVAAREMPPWPAGPMSVAFHGDRGLRNDEVQAVLDWIEAGSELDVDPKTPLSGESIVGLDHVDAEVSPNEPYDGSPAKSDDYRCLMYEPELDKAVMLTGYDFIPDQTEVVHHAVGSIVDAAERERAEQLEAEDDGAGWECYGGSRLRDDETFLVWAPGQGATVYPEGSGLRLEPGQFMVIQVHYHFDIDAPADNSSLQMRFANIEDQLDDIRIAEYAGPAEIPCSSDEVGPLCDREAAKELALERFGEDGFQADGFNALCGVTPADFAHMTNGTASSSCDLPAQEFGQIVSVMGHEHEIGSSFRMTLNPEGPDEQVLLDIPKWSFDWQYNYYPVDSIEVVPGDTVRLECTWDRALRDPDLEPSYVLWADGTNDEMCFATITTRQMPGLDSGTDEVAGFDFANYSCLNDSLAETLGDPARAAILAGLEDEPTELEQPHLVEALFECLEPAEVGETLAALLLEDIGVPLETGMGQCLVGVLSDRDGVNEFVDAIQGDDGEAAAPTLTACFG